MNCVCVCILVRARRNTGEMNSRAVLIIILQSSIVEGNCNMNKITN